MTGLAIFLLLAGVGASVHASDFQWLSRFGALVICIGVIILARPAIVQAAIKMDVHSADTGLSYSDPEHYAQMNEPVPDYIVQDQKSRAAVGWLGPTICLVGTATNGFGDLLNKFWGV